MTETLQVFVAIYCVAAAATWIRVKTGVPWKRGLLEFAFSPLVLLAMVVIMVGVVVWILGKAFDNSSGY